MDDGGHGRGHSGRSAPADDPDFRCSFNVQDQGPVQGLAATCTGGGSFYAWAQCRKADGSTYVVNGAVVPRGQTSQAVCATGDALVSGGAWTA